VKLKPSKNTFKQYFTLILQENNEVKVTIRFVCDVFEPTGSVYIPIDYIGRGIEKTREQIFFSTKIYTIANIRSIETLVHTFINLHIWTLMH